jgi:hypothetical protein
MGHSTEGLELSARRARPKSVTPTLPRGRGMGASPLDRHQPTPPVTAHELRTVLEAAARSGPPQLLVRGQE